jgi:hypothetical protein
MAKDDKEYTIKFSVAGEAFADSWSGVDAIDALNGWWRHVNDQQEVDLKRPGGGWLRTRPKDIVYAEVLPHGR